MNTRGLARCLTSLVLFAAAAPAGAATYTLGGSWSNRKNPHPPWTLLQGNTALPSVSDWTPISDSDPAYNPASGHIPQPAWAPSNVAGRFLPAWFKAAVTPAMAAYGWHAGDVIVHTTDMANGGSSGDAGLLFASPTSGAVTISGSIYNARNMNRPQLWQIAVNGTAIAKGVLPGDGSVTRAAPTRIHLCGFSVSLGDRITLVVTEGAPPNGAGDFVGVSLKIAIN